MKDSFIQFPNYLVWNYKKSTDTLIHEYGDKILHILSYLDGSVTRLEDVSFSIENMITTCGYIPKSGKGNINDQFRSIIIDLVSKGILEVKNNKDISTCKITDFVRCEYIPFAEKDKLKGFFPVKHDNYLKIVNNDTKLNKLTLLKIYYYILARLNRRSGDIKDIHVTGGKAEVFWDSFYVICKDLDITDNTLTKYLEYLNELELIYYNNIGMVLKNDVQSTANNVYAVDKEELIEGLKQSTLWYTDNGYMILKDKDREKLSRINGLSGKITSETNRGKDVTKLQNKLDKLTNKKTDKQQIADLKGIINSRYKNILEIDDAYNLDLPIEISWKDYLPTDVNNYTVADYKKVLSIIEDIEKEMNKKLDVD